MIDEDDLVELPGNSSLVPQAQSNSQIPTNSGQLVSRNSRQCIQGGLKARRRLSPTPTEGFTGLSESFAKWEQLLSPKEYLLVEVRPAMACARPCCCPRRRLKRLGRLIRCARRWCQPRSCEKGLESLPHQQPLALHSLSWRVLEAPAVEIRLRTENCGPVADLRAQTESGGRRNAGPQFTSERAKNCPEFVPHSHGGFRPG